MNTAAISCTVSGTLSGNRAPSFSRRPLKYGRRRSATVAGLAGSTRAATLWLFSAATRAHLDGRGVGCVAMLGQPIWRNQVSSAPDAAGQEVDRAQAGAHPKLWADLGDGCERTGLALSVDGEREEGIDRGFERAGTPLHLGE